MQVPSEALCLNIVTLFLFSADHTVELICPIVRGARKLTESTFRFNMIEQGTVSCGTTGRGFLIPVNTLVHGAKLSIVRRH